MIHIRQQKHGKERGSKSWVVEEVVELEYAGFQAELFEQGRESSSGTGFEPS